MQIVPLQAVPSQTLQINLGGQACTINVYQKGSVGGYVVLATQSANNIDTNLAFDIETSSSGDVLTAAVYVDLYINGALIIGGVIGLNGNRIVRDAYLGFIGDLAFYDQIGNSDPIYTSLGTQYLLVYLAPGDV